MRMQAESLERLLDRLVAAAPERARAAYEALPPEGRERARRRLGHALLSTGREAMLAAHATEAERAALRSGDEALVLATTMAVRRRVTEAVLAPHRAALEALPEAERAARKARLLEEAFWEGVRARGEELRGALARVLQEQGRGKGGGNGNGGPEARERFREEFGVDPSEIGNHRAARALAQAARLVPEDRRAAFLEGVRAELRRIRALPEAERGPALRALLERLGGERR